MRVFKIKTGDDKIVNAYKKGQNVLTIDHLIQYEDIVYIGAPVLLLFGGDGTPWTNGLYAIARIHSKPLEFGYERAARGQYYKLEIEIALRLNKPFEKKDFIRYPESFDSGVAPSTKGERNQALGIIDDDSPKTIASICRALLDSDLEYESLLRTIFGKETIDYALNQSIVFTQYHNQIDEPEEQNKCDNACIPKQIICFGAPGTGKSRSLSDNALEFEKNNAIRFKSEKRKEKFLQKLEKDGKQKYIQYLNEHSDLLGVLFTYNKREDVKKLFELKKKDDPKNDDYWIVKRYLEYASEEPLYIQHCERVTFHPNYSYTQFVGTYKPIQDPNDENQIKYEYVPGPFMRTYRRAVKYPKQKFLLIIEEINRANVAAVFGDVFQLLDRKNGASEYPIVASEDIKKYLKDNGIDDCEELRIPSNMYIWATMNSADQGVFPMDTAFKRRWEFEYIGIDDNQEGIEKYEIPLQKKEDGSHEWLKWNGLRHSINDKLTEMKINEDKLLGPYFISEEKLKLVEGKKEEKADEFVKAFKSKVLMYLFEDAVKMRPGDLFDENAVGKLRFSDICKKFDEIGQGIFNFKK